MQGTSEEATQLPHPPEIPNGSFLVAGGDYDPVLKIEVSVLRHRDGKRRKRNLVYNLHCVLYRSDGGVLHSLNASGPDRVLARDLERTLNLAKDSRSLDLTTGEVRNPKRMRVR